VCEISSICHIVHLVVPINAYSILFNYLVFYYEHFRFCVITALQPEILCLIFRVTVNCNLKKFRTSCTSTVWFNISFKTKTLSVIKVNEQGCGISSFRLCCTFVAYKILVIQYCVSVFCYMPVCRSVWLAALVTFSSKPIRSRAKYYNIL